MISKVLSCTSIGIDCLPVEVEVDVSEKGLPSFSIVGLGDKSIEEAKDRVRSAIKNSGFFFPKHHVTINLAPADLPKVGSSYDLAIAVAILLASGQIMGDFSNDLFVGELSLDGKLRNIPGILSIVSYAKENGFENIFLPDGNKEEAAIIPFNGLFPLKSLLNFFEYTIDKERITPFVSNKKDDEEADDFEIDLKDIKGQEQAKRALEISAAGGHNLLLVGPPGVGKTMMARAIPSIMPKMSLEEKIEVTKIYSVYGQVKSDKPLVSRRPFRTPHHTISHISLVGGGQHPKPGEISLSHRGVLFLDEISEFHRLALESLRQPMEDGCVTINRVKGSLTFPAKFLLIAASNPCPCGYYGDEQIHRCRCTSREIASYKKKISGPLLDRIDLFLTLRQVETEKLVDQNLQSEDSLTIYNRVERARFKQRQRFKDDHIFCNAEMSSSQINKYVKITKEAKSLLKNAIFNLGMSARSYQKSLKVAQTIADLSEKEVVDENCVAESLSYRKKIE